MSTGGGKEVVTVLYFQIFSSCTYLGSYVPTLSNITLPPVHLSAKFAALKTPPKATIPATIHITLNTKTPPPLAPKSKSSTTTPLQPVPEHHNTDPFSHLLITHSSTPPTRRFPWTTAALVCQIHDLPGHHRSISFFLKKKWMWLENGCR